MNKTFGDKGFVIFSDSMNYEFSLLREYFTADPNIENIVFVYSKKNDVSALYAGWLREWGKRLIIVPFEEYNHIEYASAIEALNLAKTVMIIKDLRFMLKRLDERLSMMQIKHICYKKIIIDEAPFVVDTWKFYFPYSFIDKTLLGYSHSYAFEAAMRSYEDDDTLSDPCDPEKLALKTRSITFINYARYFRFHLSVEEYKARPDEVRRYEKLREDLFGTEKSIQRVLAKLHKYASALTPGHNLPLRLNKIYEWRSQPKVIIHKTDLKIDNYLFGQMEHLINQTNTLVRYLREEG